MVYIYYKHKPHKKEKEKKGCGELFLSGSRTNIYRSNLHKFVPQSFRRPRGRGRVNHTHFVRTFYCVGPPHEKNKRRTKPTLNCPQVCIVIYDFHNTKKWNGSALHPPKTKRENVPCSNLNCPCMYLYIRFSLSIWREMKLDLRDKRDFWRCISVKIF